MHIKPGERIREESMHGDQRDLTGVIRLGGIEAGILEELLIPLNSVKEPVPSTHAGLLDKSRERTPNQFAQDDAAARKLWDASEKLTGFTAQA
jgi:hypothetical protein